MHTLIFIDGANVFHAVHEYEYTYKIDYQKLAHLLADGEYEVQFYTGVPHDIPESEKQFLEALRHIPHFHIHTRELVENKEKGVDVEIAVDMIEASYEHTEHVILVSGDLDLLPAVQRLQQHGIRVTVASFPHSTANELREAADEYIDLSEHYDELELKRQ